MSFAWIPPGLFLRGSPLTEPVRQSNETQHLVILTRGFFLGIHPVTQSQWQAVMGKNPSWFRGDQRPVECVSWEDCQEFCERLRQQDGMDTVLPSPYRLPTEAEWEYACRAGTSSPFFFGETLGTNQANYHAPFLPDGGLRGQYRQETMPVGSFPANAWGLADMHGNVFEWCADWFASYPEGEVKDPLRKHGEGARVLRGGSWHSLMERCRSACRGWGAPGYRGSDVGCRLCFRVDHHYVI
jgi:formylglycine-generating enzyme required for sulfatase activity